MVLAGSAHVRAKGGTFIADAGNTVLLPAHVEEGCIDGGVGTILLRTTCASPLDRAT
jgi:mannose-6-phosphate isomerase class I